MSKECRLHLEKSLASLLSYDLEDVTDFIDPLLSFDSKDDVLEYLSGLLGRQDEEVLSFVNDIVKFQRGEQVAAVGINGDTCTSETKPSSTKNAGSKVGVKNGNIRSSVETQRKDEEEAAAAAREKQRKQDEERRRKQEIELEQNKKLERIKMEQQKEMDRIQRVQRNVKKQNNKNSIKKQPQPRQKEGRNTNSSSSNKVVPIVTKPNRKEQKDAEKPALPLTGKAKIICGCFGTVHKPLTNCLNCGRILCAKEGYGYCPSCSFLVEKPTIPQGAELDKAIMHKERLLKFDRDSASRTVVFDSQADYYSNSKSNWLTKEEQLDAEMKEESRRKDLHERKYILKLDT